MKHKYLPYLIIPILLVLTKVLSLAPLLLTVIFSLFIIKKLNFLKRKWVAVILFIIVITLSIYGLHQFSKAAFLAFPKITQNSLQAMINWAKGIDVSLPFTDFESLKTYLIEFIRERIHYLGNFANFARESAMQIVLFIIGIVVAIGVFLNPKIHLDEKSSSSSSPDPTLYSFLSSQTKNHLHSFYQSFSTVMGAQIIISAIDTFITGVFVLIVGLPYFPVVIGMTFIVGLIPIIGNLISNTIIIGIAFTVSPNTALAALIFLVVIHKLEYFLNSKIIGDRIRNPVWLTLLALVLGEKIMGIPGLILAPVVLHYIRLETSKITLKNS